MLNADPTVDAVVNLFVERQAMLPGMDSTGGKIGYAVLGIAVIVFAVWRIGGSVTGGSGDVKYAMVCAECGAEAELELPAGGGDLPLECPKCKKKALWIATPCPFCGKALPLVDKKQPKVCKYCEKDLPEL